MKKKDEPKLLVEDVTFEERRRACELFNAHLKARTLEREAECKDKTIAALQEQIEELTEEKQALVKAHDLDLYVLEIVVERTYQLDEDGKPFFYQTPVQHVEKFDRVYDHFDGGEGSLCIHRRLEDGTLIHTHIIEPVLRVSVARRGEA